MCLDADAAVAELYRTDWGRILATVIAMAAYFLTLILWAGQRANRIENFVEKLEPRLRDADVTKHEGLVLVGPQ